MFSVCIIRIQNRQSSCTCNKNAKNVLVGRKGSGWSPDLILVSVLKMIEIHTDMLENMYTHTSNIHCYNYKIVYLQYLSESAIGILSSFCVRYGKGK